MRLPLTVVFTKRHRHHHHRHERTWGRCHPITTSSWTHMCVLDHRYRTIPGTRSPYHSTYVCVHGRHCPTTRDTHTWSPSTHHPRHVHDHTCSDTVTVPYTHTRTTVSPVPSEVHLHTTVSSPLSDTYPNVTVPGRTPSRDYRSTTDNHFLDTTTDGFSWDQPVD